MQDPELEAAFSSWYTHLERQRLIRGLKRLIALAQKEKAQPWKLNEKIKGPDPEAAEIVGRYLASRSLQHLHDDFLRQAPGHLAMLERIQRGPKKAPLPRYAYLSIDGGKPKKILSSKASAPGGPPHTYTFESFGSYTGGQDIERLGEDWFLSGDYGKKTKVSVRFFKDKPSDDSARTTRLLKLLEKRGKSDAAQDTSQTEPPAWRVSDNLDFFPLEKQHRAAAEAAYRKGFAAGVLARPRSIATKKKIAKILAIEKRLEKRGRATTTTRAELLTHNDQQIADLLEQIEEIESLSDKKAKREKMATYRRGAQMKAPFPTPLEDRAEARTIAEEKARREQEAKLTRRAASLKAAAKALPPETAAEKKEREKRMRDEKKAQKEKATRLKKEAQENKKWEAPYKREILATIERHRKAFIKAKEAVAKEIPPAAELKKMTLQELSDWQAEIKEVANKKKIAIAGKPKNAQQREEEKEKKAADKKAAAEAKKANAAAKKAEEARKKAEEKSQKAAALAAKKDATKAEKKRAKEQAALARKEARKEAELAKRASAETAKAARKASQEGSRLPERPEAAGIPFTMDALLAASDKDAQELIAMAGKTQRANLRRQLAGELRIIRKEIQKMKLARKQRLKVIRDRCRDAARDIRKRMIRLREEFLRQWKELKGEDAARRSSCSTDSKTVFDEINPNLDSATRRMLRLIGLKGELGKHKAALSPKALAAARKRAEALKESDDFVAFDLQKVIPGAEKWWKEKGAKMATFKPKNIPEKKSRSEHVLEYLQRYPEVIDDFQMHQAQKELKEREKQEAKLTRQFKASSVARAQRAQRGVRRGRGGLENRRTIGARRDWYAQGAPF